MKNIYLQGMNKITTILLEMSQEYSKIFNDNFFAYRDLERKRASLMGAQFDDPDDWYRIYGKVIDCYVDITNERLFNGFHGILVLKYLPLDDFLTPIGSSPRILLLFVNKLLMILLTKTQSLGL